MQKRDSLPMGVGGRRRSTANSRFAALANIVNAVQRVLSSGEYQGAIWTEGSPRLEETLYWFNLLLDTIVPLCGNSAQRPHGTISNDGPRNIVDSVSWIESRAWANETGRNCAGVVLVSDQRVFAAREVAKVDARPGGYVAVGGHGGILDSAGGEDASDPATNSGDEAHLSVGCEHHAPSD